MIFWALPEVRRLAVGFCSSSSLGGPIYGLKELKAMVITDYRVQSVLRTYGRQLQKSKLARRLEIEDTKRPEEKVAISEEARRRMIMDGVATQAFEQACPK